jgi:hypothetical protein
MMERDWKLAKRINRQLEKQERRLRKMRGESMVSNFGEWAVWDIRYNVVSERFVDVEFLASELNLLDCCICGKRIESFGNNADPVMPGQRCCGRCNAIHVLPARIPTTAKAVGV